MANTITTDTSVRSVYKGAWYSDQDGMVVDMDGDIAVVMFANPLQPGTFATVKLPTTVLVAI